jgi:uracil-DNA glycosylase
MTVFVGDRPSSKNASPDVPFVGTPSHKILLQWIDKLEVKDYMLLNSHTNQDIDLIINCYFIGAKIVALGNNASKRICVVLIPHFKLPHPSPRNRKCNDKEWLGLALAACKEYVA